MTSKEMSFGSRSAAIAKKTATAIAAAAIPPRERVKKSASNIAGTAAAARARNAIDLAQVATWSTSGSPIAISAPSPFQ